MFQLSYSEPPEDHSEENEELDSRLEIDLESLEKWVIANSADGEPFSISPRDMLQLIHEAMYWRERALEAEENLTGSQDMIEDLFSIAEDNRKSAQTALGVIR